MSRKTGRRTRPRVELRESRHGRELIIDDTFASWYEPGRVATGSVWDALVAPLLVLPRARRRRVLVLGLGGGSAARVARALAPSARIVGVERDPEVIRLARRGFDLDEIGVEVVEDDARAFLERDRGRYDLVLDDVFVGSGDAVRKPDWLPHPGTGLAARRVATGGLLVCNTLDETAAVATVLRTLFPALLRIDVDEFDNRVLVAGPRGLQAAALRRAVAANPVLSGTLPRLRFRTLTA
ncbi:MAG: fused MFS/spermidine synthase [Proteobacteria bacterium]|nr:fused MFS/spermidine synthase [Pseudomonadota bacterium]